MEDIELAGKTYSKLTIVDVNKYSGYQPGIYPHKDRLAIYYVDQFHCEPVDVTIDELVLRCPVTAVPEFLLDRASYIRVDGDIQTQLPPEYRHKFKRSVYSMLYQCHMVPGCTYHALGVSELMEIDLKLVNRLILTGSINNLMDMVEYVSNDQDLKFRKVSIRHARFNSDIPFDMSLAANIKADIMYFNDGAFYNFRKFVSETTVPRIQWGTKESEQIHSFRCRTITKELATEVEANIEDNFTLVWFTGADIYWNHYEDVQKLAARNAAFALNRRFKTTKLAAPSE